MLASHMSFSRDTHELPVNMISHDLAKSLKTMPLCRHWGIIFISRAHIFLPHAVSLKLAAHVRTDTAVVSQYASK